MPEFLNSFLIAIFLEILLLILLIFFGYLRYKNSINPLFQFAIFDIGILTIISAIAAYNSYSVESEFIVETLKISIIYIFGYYIAFAFKKIKMPMLFFNSILFFITSKKVKINLKKQGKINQIILIIITISLFVMLMILSGVGFLWLTDPRSAYQNNRVGVGFIYLLVQWSLLASLLYFIWKKRPKLIYLITSSLIYSVLAYFTGSKHNILSGLILVGVFYNFYYTKISLQLSLIYPGIILIIFIFIMFIQGTIDEQESNFSYFKDYVKTTSMYLSRPDEFEMQLGKATLSELWFYVPRILYPEKPYEYGVAIVNAVLFPGMAELGHTPGVLPWITAHLDFGILGVFLYGLVQGIIRRGIYESFLKNENNILAFILMVQITIIPIFAYSTILLTYLIGIALFLFVKKTLVIK